MTSISCSGGSRSRSEAARDPNDPDLAFEAAALRADPGLTLLLATAEPGTPTEAALDRLKAAG
jgi:hypothetical protein